MNSHYETLGVSKASNAAEIKRAFRRLAREHHPDLNPGDAKAEARFKEINEAYEVLSDTDNRQKYDKYGENWKHAEEFEKRGASGPFERSYRTRGSSDPFGFGGMGDLEDLLGGFGGGAGSRTTSRTRRRARLEVSIEIDLQEAFEGTTRNVTITDQGAQQRRIEVDIPPGVDNGSVVRVTPKGIGSVYLNMIVSAHKRLKRTGDDLYTEVELPFDDAILGAEVDVQTLRGKVRLTVPAGSQNGQSIRLAGQGMPRLGAPDDRGSLYVTLRPTFPAELTDEEQELIGKFRDLRSDRR